MLGLDAAGKTTIIYKLCPDIANQMVGITAIGFNPESLSYNGFDIDCWDVGGQDKIRMIWRHYYPGTRALIFVIDSIDQERLDNAREELYLLLAEQDLDEAVLLVLANKQDLPGHMAPSEIANILELDCLSPRPWHIFPVCAITGEGLSEAFEWLKVACVKPATACGLPASQLDVYYPGEYIVHTRLQVLPDLPGTGMHNYKSFLPAGSHVCVEKVQRLEQKHYGFVSLPVRGWLLLGAQGCGNHVRQKDFALSLSCTPDEKGGCTCQCYSLGGEELAVLQLDSSVESVEDFRAKISSQLRKSAISLKIVTPSGGLLPLNGSKDILCEALVLNYAKAPQPLSSGTDQTSCSMQ